MRYYAKYISPIRYYARYISPIRYYARYISPIRYYARYISPIRYYIKYISPIRYYIKYISPIRYYAKYISSIRYYAREGAHYALRKYCSDYSHYYLRALIINPFPLRNVDHVWPTIIQVSARVSYRSNGPRDINNELQCFSGVSKSLYQYKCKYICVCNEI